MQSPPEHFISLFEICCSTDITFLSAYFHIYLATFKIFQPKVTFEHRAEFHRFHFNRHWMHTKTTQNDRNLPREANPRALCSAHAEQFVPRLHSTSRCFCIREALNLSLPFQSGAPSLKQIWMTSANSWRRTIGSTRTDRCWASATTT